MGPSQESPGEGGLSEESSRWCWPVGAPVWDFLNGVLEVERPTLNGNHIIQDGPWSERKGVSPYRHIISLLLITEMVWAVVLCSGCLCFPAVTEVTWNQE